MHSSGTTTSAAIMGSGSTGLAFRATSLVADLESHFLRVRVVIAGVVRMAFKSDIACPASTPRSSASRMPTPISPINLVVGQLVL